MDRETVYKLEILVNLNILYNHIQDNWVWHKSYNLGWHLVDSDDTNR
jgi:hypothetical protein